MNSCLSDRQGGSSHGPSSKNRSDTLELRNSPNSTQTLPIMNGFDYPSGFCACL